MWQFAYDKLKGTISNRRVLLRTERNELPDGLTVDVNGSIWIAIWNGGRVVQVNPNGSATHAVEVPARFASSATFGGVSLDTLYVTSATRSEHASDGLAPYEYEGAVFGIPNCGRGVAEFPSRLKS